MSEGFLICSLTAKIAKCSIESMEVTMRGFAMPFFMVIVLLAVIASGVTYYAVTKPEAPDNLGIENISAENTDAITKEESGMTSYSGTILAGESALLLDFKKADYDAAIKTGKLIVLYFYANWCPICKAEFPIMQEAFNELNTDNVIGFRVNYNDDETDNDEKNLAREFGVAYQHTKVFVKNKQRILKSPEGWDDKRYDMEINKAITQ